MDPRYAVFGGWIIFGILSFPLLDGREYGDGGFDWTNGGNNIESQLFILCTFYCLGLYLYDWVAFKAGGTKY